MAAGPRVGGTTSLGASTEKRIGGDFIGRLGDQRLNEHVFNAYRHLRVALTRLLANARSVREKDTMICILYGKIDDIEKALKDSV